MKKYIVIRVIFIIFTLMIAFTFGYFALKFATNEKYYHFPMDEFFFMTVDEFKVYFINIVTKNDWGLTIDGVPVWDVLTSRIGLSFKLNIYALIFYLPVGVILGFLSAYYHNTVFDKVVNWFLMTFSAIPSFILMFLLMFLLGYYTDLFHYQYVAGYGIKNFYLPIIAMSLLPLSTFTRVIRGELLSKKTSEYVMLAKIKGLNQKQILWRHVLRNSIIPLVPEVPTAFMFALTGSFWVEILYGIPGVGPIFWESLTSVGPFGYFIQIEQNLMMVIILFYSSMTLLVGFISDVALRVLDPRIVFQTSARQKNEGGDRI